MRGRRGCVPFQWGSRAGRRHRVVVAQRGELARAVMGMSVFAEMEPGMRGCRDEVGEITGVSCGERMDMTSISR